MSIPKDELYRLVKALPESKTLKAKYLLETLVNQNEGEEKEQELSLAEQFKDIIGIVDVKGNFSEKTGKQFKEILLKKQGNKQ